MAESSVKRMLAKGDMPLSRIDEICRALHLDFADLARNVADSRPLLQQITREQELPWLPTASCCSAICVLSQWTLEQIVATYRISEPEASAIWRSWTASASSSCVPATATSCAWPRPSAGRPTAR
jgi:hypothetical protein